MVIIGGCMHGMMSELGRTLANFWFVPQGEEKRHNYEFAASVARINALYSFVGDPVFSRNALLEI